MTDAPVTRLVCGLGRCGTSLACQMLAAGGADVAGEWPAFEPPECGFEQRRDPEAWARVEGRVVKLLNPQVTAPVLRGLVRAIWLSRDAKQQGASQVKFSNAMFRLRNNRDARRALARAIERDTPGAIALVRRWTGEPFVHRLAFETMILDPLFAAAKLREALALPGLDLAAMARVVRPRSPACYDGLIELELVAELA